MSNVLWAEEVQLNLPERFDAKIVKGKWFDSDGRSGIFTENQDPTNPPQECETVHFASGKFYLSCKYKHIISSTHVEAIFVKKWEGTYNKNGELNGVFSTYQNNFSTDFGNYMKIYENGTIKGQIGTNNIKIIQKFKRTKVYDHGKYNEYHSLIWSKDGSWILRNNPDRTIKVILHLKIIYSQDLQNNITTDKQISNQNQNTQTEPIPNEPEPIQPQANANISPQDDKVTLNIDPQEQPVQPQKNPCTPPIDEAWQEYCEAKAYNAKIKEQEEADAKAAEQDANEEEEYQKRLDAWNEEERQSNIEFIKSQKAKREKADKIWKEEDKASNDSIAKEQAERKAKQAEIEKAHKIIDRFGDDYETQSAAHKKIDELSKTADTQKAKKIKNAIRKQFYDSKQIKLQADAEYQTSKAKELGKKEKYLNTVKETSLTVNKVLARIDSEIDPLKIGNKIVDLQENSYDAIDSYSKGGLSKVADDFIEKKANELSNDWAGVAKEKAEEYKQYHSKKGLKLKPDEIYYDKNGKQLKKVNAYQKVYDKKGNEVSFSFGKRIFKKTFSKLNDDYNSIQGTAEHIKNIKEGVMSGDVNKVVNETLDMTEKEDEGDEKKDGAKKID